MPIFLVWQPSLSDHFLKPRIAVDGQEERIEVEEHYTNGALLLASLQPVQRFPVLAQAGVNGCYGVGIDVSQRGRFE